MQNISNELISNHNGNRRISNGATINNYLITIPRCDLPKKYLFDGLVNLCSRLAVSKEKHSITHLDSCCKNSSIPKNTSLNNTNTSVNAPSQTGDQVEIRRNEPITKERFQKICDDDDARITNIALYKKLRNTTELADSFRYSPTVDQNESSFLNDTLLQDDNQEWIHCKSHIHIYAGI